MLEGAAYQPDCPVNLLSMDAVHFHNGQHSGHECRFLHETLHMHGGYSIPLPRNTDVKLHFVNIISSGEFNKLGVSEGDVVQYWV